MAKGFPYFKFIATEWLTGDIVFEEYDLQGLFINICALYWHRNAELTVDEINKRYKRKDLLDKLIPNFITLSEDNKIKISFLDEQLLDAGHISKVNSENGSAGGRPIKSDRKGNVIFYLLKCHLDEELFYKAGITSGSISRRFSNLTGNNKKIPYHFSVIYTIELNTIVALSIEKGISENFQKYQPKIRFSGHNECYVISDKIIEYIEKSIAKTETKPKLSETKAKKSKEELERELEEEIEVKKKEFKQSLRDFTTKYSTETLKAFFDYWTELNKSKTKMRFESEKFFDLNRRLTTWSRNEHQKFDKGTPAATITLTNLLNR